MRERTVGSVLLAAALVTAACERREGAAPPGAAGDRGVVSVSRVVAAAEPRPGEGGVTLDRGTEVRVLAAQEGSLRVHASGVEGWVPADAVEPLDARAAREAWRKEVVSYAAHPARMLEASPVLLAPDYGAARWGEIAEGDAVEVLFAEHDFFGVRIPVAGLAYVPARSARLLPSGDLLPALAERPAAVAPPGVNAAGADVPAAGFEEGAGAGDVPRTGAESGPLESLPPAAEEPEIVTRVEPVYPESARQLGRSGEVVLRIVVGVDGRVTDTSVVSGDPLLARSAEEAVRRWVYRPARVDGRAVAVVKRVKVTFQLAR